MEAALLMTGTLQPSPDVWALKRSDPEQRIREYLDAAERWDASPLQVESRWFVDNSPALDETAWAHFAKQLGTHTGGRVQTLRVQPAPQNGAVIQKGKGEAALLDQTAASLNDMGIQYFVKVTGRLFVTNASAIFSRTQATHGIRAALSSRLNHADTRLFGMPTANWLEHYAGMAAEVDEPSGVYLEHVFAKRTLRAVSGGATFDGMPRLPRYQGHSGSMDVDYGNRRQVLRTAMHEVARTPLRRSTGLTL